MASSEFHHFGVPTSAKAENESFIEGAKVHVTDPERHPFRVEFLRFEADSPLPEAVRTRPHAAFIVPDLNQALEGQNVIIPPFDATEELRCAFIMDDEAVIEVMEKR
jgi:hypothetical protein